MRKKKEEKPKAYIREECLQGHLPDGNPFGVNREEHQLNKNSKEFKKMTSIMVDFGKMRRSAPISSKISY